MHVKKTSKRVPQAGAPTPFRAVSAQLKELLGTLTHCILSSCMMINNKLCLCVLWCGCLCVWCVSCCVCCVVVCVFVCVCVCVCVCVINKLNTGTFCITPCIFSF